MSKRIRPSGWVVALAFATATAGVGPGAAHAADFVGHTYGGAAFSTGAGPYEWSFRSSHGSGEWAGVEYRFGSETAWHRCLEPRVFNGVVEERVPVAVSLSGLAPGTYRIEIADDLSVGWLGENGIYNSSTNTCGDPSREPTEPISIDSLAIVAPETQPGTAPSPATTPPPGRSTTPPPGGSTPQPAAPGVTPAATPSVCPSGYTPAHIAGRRACLRNGQRCSYAHRREYRRYHFACARRGRHYTLLKQR